MSIWRHPGQGASERRRMNDAELPLPAPKKQAVPHGVVLFFFKSNKFGQHLGERGDKPERTVNCFKGESFRKHVYLPTMCEISD